MSDTESDSSARIFVDVRFFLGLLFIIYGAILVATSLYYSLYASMNGLTVEAFWGALMLGVGVLAYVKSDKPRDWEKAFAGIGMEKMEKRLKAKLIKD